MADMNDLERRLTSNASTPEQKEAIRQLFDRERQKNQALSVELFLQGLGQVHMSLANETEKLMKLRRMDAGMLAINFLLLLLLLGGVFAVWRMVMG